MVQTIRSYNFIYSFFRCKSLWENRQLIMKFGHDQHSFFCLVHMPSSSRAKIHWKQISFYLTTHIYVPVLLRTLNSIRGFVPPSALPSVGPLVEDDRVKNANTRIFVAAVMSVCVCECEWVGRECGWMFHAYVQPSATKL